MDDNKSTENLDVEVVDIFSPNWNEFYVDGALLTVDDYAVRIAFINHLPQNVRSGKRINNTRKVDVVMSEKAFNNLLEAMVNLKDKIDKRDKTVQLKDEE